MGFRRCDALVLLALLVACQGCDKVNHEESNSMRNARRRPRTCSFTPPTEPKVACRHALGNFARRGAGSRFRRTEPAEERVLFR